MPDSILVVVEQREGKLNRVSWETLTAGQALAADAGLTLEAAVVGNNVAGIAGEVAAKKVTKVYAIESAKFDPYTPDAFAAGLKTFIESNQPKIVLMPHTYQVRDFVPKLATAMGRTAISDCTGFKKQGDKLVFTRQMFQGKLAADVSFACEAPWFVTLQNGAFRGDKVEAGSAAAPVETVKVDIADGVVRNKPQEVFKEAKQAVDLTQAEIIVSIGRGIKEQKNIELAKQLAEALGGEIAASRPICDSGWLPIEPADWIFRSDGGAEALSCTRHQWRHSAHRRHERLTHDCGSEQRCRGPDLRNCRLRRGRQFVRHRSAPD